MIDFGEIPISGLVSLRPLRIKLFAFLNEFNLGASRSIRISIILCELIQKVYHPSANIVLQIQSRTDNFIGLLFNVRFQPESETFLEDIIALDCFEKISTYSCHKDSTCKVIQCLVSFRNEIPNFTNVQIVKLKEGLQEKSRDELNQEISLKNIELRETNNALRKFLPKDFLKSLGKENIRDVQLGEAIEKEITVFFADMRSFSTISERLSPPELISFINIFLKRVVPIIHHHDGFVLTYLGDAIMAAFPHRVSDAISASIQIINELERYNSSMEGEISEKIQIGIGINFGKVMMGIIGQEDRMEPTIISDAVNLSSRLENLTKNYGADILLSEDAYHKLSRDEGNPYIIYYRDEVRVVGRVTPTKIYEVLATEIPRFKNRLEMQSELEALMEAVKLMHWGAVVAILEKLKLEYPEDKLVEFYWNRMQTLMEQGSDREDTIYNWNFK